MRLMWTKRGKACLKLIFITKTNCESMSIDLLALRSVQLEVSEKTPQRRHEKSPNVTRYMLKRGL